MKKSHLIIGAVAIVVLIIIVGFVYVQQSATFMAQINQATSSMFATSQSTTTAATSTALTPAASGTTKTVTKTTKTPAPVATTPGVPPKISKFEPAAATVGTTITVMGTGFDYTTNYITFGASLGRHHPDGTADNVIATVGSADGKTLTFVVPTSSASGLLCDATNHCVGISATKIVPGNYPMTVKNKNGASPVDVFTVTAQ